MAKIIKRSRRRKSNSLAAFRPDPPSKVPDTLSVTKRDVRGAPLTLEPIDQQGPWKKSIRGIAKDLVGRHSTQIAQRLREGTLSPNLRLALKYLGFIAAYESGKPVETHRMIGLDEGPSGAYNLSKLPREQQKKLLALLKAAKDTTESKGDV
jgi:hypothetical protein